MSQFLEQYKNCPESKLADALLQPVEYSYTVASLEALLASCDLELLAPCINQFDKANGTFFWNMEFEDSGAQQLYDSLPDTRRWQVSNCLMLKRSPMLWFYLQRTDSGRVRRSEAELSEEFLAKKFTVSQTTRKLYMKMAGENYAANERLTPFPGPHVDQLCGKIIASVATSPDLPMRAIFEQLEVERRFALVNKLRLSLTTNAFPYLIARS